MAINPASLFRMTRDFWRNPAFVDVDINVANPNDNITSAKALGVYVVGTGQGGTPGGSAAAPVTADGADVAEGATTAPAYTDMTGASAGTVVGLLKGIFRSFFAQTITRIASSAAAGNPLLVKAAAGAVRSFWGQNGAAITYLQIYNKATAPVLGTDTPALTYPIPANAVFNQGIPGYGAAFPAGIAIAFTTDVAGTTGAAAAAVTSFALLTN